MVGVAAAADVQMFGGGPLQRLELDDILFSCQMFRLGFFSHDEPLFDVCRGRNELILQNHLTLIKPYSSCLIIISIIMYHRRPGQYSLEMVVLRPGIVMN